MRPILTESLIILGLLLFNGIFAMSEIAVVTSRRSRLEQRSREGDSGARRALELVDEPARFLSTVQIGITLVGVLAGAFGGATIAEELALRLETIPAVAPYSEAIALGAVVAVIAFCSLVIGELVPKRIAMQAPERIAARVAPPMQLLARLASPLVTVLTFTTTGILRLLRVSEAKGTRVTEDEIRAVIAEGRRSGAVHVAEHEMIEGVLRLGDRDVRDVMIPRSAIDWVGVDEGTPGLRERLARPRAELVLLCRQSVDDVIGILRPARVLTDALSGAPVDLVAAAETSLFVPGTMGLLRLLELFKQSRQRVAIVLDEYGGVEGLVALEDVIEEVVGEVAAAAGEGAAEMVRRDDGSWLVDGATEIDDVVERLALAPLPPRERSAYRTLAGFAMARLGRVPRLSDVFVWEGIRFEVVDMDERRVDKVLITPPPIGPR